jgi:hypothetical protein
MVRKYGRDFKLSPEQILKIGVNENGKKFSTLKPAVQEQKVYEILNDTKFIETMIKLSGFGEFERILHNFFKNGNVGKKIRIDNLLYKLRKLPSIDVCKSDGNYLTCDSINQLAHLVQNYMDVYIRIKSIDMTMFETQILSFVNSIEIYMMDEIKYIRELSFAITYYDKIVATILKPHFAKYYDTNNYSVFIKEHVNQIIKQMFSSDVKDLDIIICLDMLQKVGNFTKENVSELFLHLIANPRAENTIQFEDKNDQNLIRVLSDCAQNGIMISNVLRFILINKINTGAYLYTRYLIYKKMGEITLSGYIYICMPRPSIDMVVRGCQDSDMSDPQFELDLFYLNYERKNG